VSVVVVVFVVVIVSKGRLARATGPAVQKNKNVKWSENLWSQSDRRENSASRLKTAGELKIALAGACIHGDRCESDARA